jgi:DNA modification methylase
VVPAADESLRPGADSGRQYVALDPFSGSATAGAVCIELGRQFLGIERNPEFARLSRLRLQAGPPNGQS